MAKKATGIHKLNDISEEFDELISSIKKLDGITGSDLKNVKNRDISRPMATKLVWLYIKQEDLQNPDNGREILCDTTLKAMTKKNKITMFQIGGMLSNHLS